MIRITAPASSANIGPGFDCLGIALNLYNVFTVEPDEYTTLTGVEERFNNSDNLFLQAYREGCREIGAKPLELKVDFDCDIPVCRGLGSSSALLCAGLFAANSLHGEPMDRDELFQLAAKMEGHPDNVAPCIYGGLTAAAQAGGHFVCRQFSIHPDYKFTALIPDFEVSTEIARSVLPSEYSRETVVKNSSNLMLLCSALANGDIELLRAVGKDYIHEPYRRSLIRGYDDIKKIAEEDCGGVVFISGSGSTLLLLHQKELSYRALSHIAAIKDPVWTVKELHIAEGSSVCRI
jgi:homoserine kinase